MQPLKNSIDTRKLIFYNNLFFYIYKNKPLDKYFNKTYNQSIYYKNIQLYYYNIVYYYSLY